MPHRRLITLLVAVTLVSACAPVATGVTGAKAPASRKVAMPGTSPVDTPAGGTGDGALQVRETGTIMGRLMAPPSLAGAVRIVSNNGGGLISDKGGGLISDKGGGYRVLALAQAPVAGAWLELVDATGQAILDAAGVPVQTLSGPDGAFAFDVELRANNWLVRVKMDAGDPLVAIVPKSGDRTGVTVDLVSTLTTTYILEQYVKPQADAQLVLDRLPPEVEAATREKAATALASDAIGQAARLETAAIVEAVNRLRAADSALDAQLESVKKLLVVAGLDALGTGQAATEVYFRGISAVLPAPDGSLYLLADKLWWLGKDGKLRDVPVQGAWSGPLVAIDDQGRLWRADPALGKLWRRAADGTLTELAAPGLQRFAPTSGDGFLYVSHDAAISAPVTLWRSSGSGAPSAIGTYTGEQGYIVRSGAWGADANGRAAFVYAGTSAPRAYRVEPTSGALSQVMAWGQGGIGYLEVDPRGQFHIERDGALLLVDADGAERQLPGNRTMGPLSFQAIAPSADGAFYTLGNRAPSGGASRSLYRLAADGAKVLVAGKDTQAVADGTDPTQLALAGPRGLMVDAAGVVYIADAGALLVVDPEKGASTRLAKGVVSGREPGRLALAPDGSLIVQMVVAGSGFEDPAPLYRLQGTGAPTLLHAPAGGFQISHWSVAADGSLYVAESRREGLSTFSARIVKLAPDGAASTIVPESAGYGWWTGLALVNGGTLIASGYDLETDVYVHREWNGSALVPRASAPPFYPELVDAFGRWIGSRAPEGGKATERVVVRHDPATGATEVLVGPGGRHEAAAASPDFRHACFDRAGNLYVVDLAAKQVKRIAADEL